VPFAPGDLVLLRDNPRVAFRVTGASSGSIVTAVHPTDDRYSICALEDHLVAVPAGWRDAPRRPLIYNEKQLSDWLADNQKWLSTIRPLLGDL